MAFRKKNKKEIKKSEHVFPWNKKIIPHATFKDIIKEILRNKDISMKKEALSILHEASESYLIEIFESASCIAEVRNSSQISLKDFKLATALVNKMTNKA